MNLEKLLIIDFGGHYTQLLARRIRKLNVYCEIVPYTIPLEKIVELHPRALILSGDDADVKEEDIKFFNTRLFNLNIPVLGICYGMFLMVELLGGDIEKTGDNIIYERDNLNISSNEKSLFDGIPCSAFPVWLIKGNRVNKVPGGFIPLAYSSDNSIAAIGDEEKSLYGVQFQPAAGISEGLRVIKNFLFNICSFKGDWAAKNFIEDYIHQIRQKISSTEHAICGLSGGVDSSVSAALVHRAIGDRLTCIFVDHGLLRKGEREQVSSIFQRDFQMKLKVIDASDEFLDLLQGVTDPEKKRKIIGNHFIRVFEKEAKKIGNARFLVQGTLYSDIIESGTATTEKIKSHHNVGGLPKDMDFDLIEPLRDLFKDEVREVGAELGLPDKIVWRHPFPGPGLAIRILGEVTREKLEILREADAIIVEEIKKAGFYDKIWQVFAVLPDFRSVGVSGDKRTYAHTIVLRAVESDEGMTADWVRIPYNILEGISNRVVNEVPHVNRLVYDLTPKPPSTIEWE